LAWWFQILAPEFGTKSWLQSLAPDSGGGEEQ